jgi:hypothetical protein
MHGFLDQAQSARQFVEETPPMEHRLKRKLSDGALTFSLGVDQARTPSIVIIAASAGFAGRAARADIERMRTIPVPRI